MRGFTLTELLIVIAIIGVLASLIAAAAVNALRASRRNNITLEINQISGSLEQFFTEYGQYPPNGMNPDPQNAPAAGSPAALVQADFERMFTKAFPRHNESRALIRGLCGQNLAGATGENLVNGMNADESLVFWLGGFSSDPLYPISGTGGPSFVDAGGDNDGALEASDEVLENRSRRYEFDLARLGPRDDSNVFSGRFIVYIDPRNPNVTRRINFWHYKPPSSEQPLAYFDTSRHKPYQYDPWAAEKAQVQVVAFKQLREGATAIANPRDVTFVNPSKFQIIHCGLDGDWGTEFFSRMSVVEAGTDVVRFPDGPFIGPIADTLTNFTEGTLADAAEE